MGFALYRIRPGKQVTAPARTCCAKCGGPLGYRWTPEAMTNSESYCKVCRWLLRDVWLKVFLDGRRPDADTVKALGLPVSWDDRQLAEPMPLTMLDDATPTVPPRPPTTNGPYEIDRWLHACREN